MLLVCMLTQKLKSEEVNNLTTDQRIYYSRLLIALNNKPSRILVDKHEKSDFNDLVKEIKKVSLKNNGILRIGYFSENTDDLKLKVICWSIKKRSFIPCASKSLINDFGIQSETTTSNSSQSISIGNLEIGIWAFLVNIKNNNIECQGKAIIDSFTQPEGKQ